MVAEDADGRPHTVGAVKSVRLPPSTLGHGDCLTKRRDMLVSSGAALLGWSAFPLGLARAGEVKKESKRQTVLYFTRSAGFEHSVVARKGGKLSYSAARSR